MVKKQNKKYFYTINPIIFPGDQMDKFKEFMEQYGNKSQKFILREIAKVKADVSKDVIDKYVKNLEGFEKMEGFVTDEERQKIHRIKQILTSNTPLDIMKRRQNTNPETQLFFGTSLLLWFLILVAIWRRPCYKPPCYPYPYY